MTLLNVCVGAFLLKKVSDFYDEAFFVKIINALKAANYFAKNAPS